MPTFCRHNRFLERCPICSAPEQGPVGAGARPRPPARRSTQRAQGGGRNLRVQRAPRAQEDGYTNGLVPGLRASADAERLAAELTFAGGRLEELTLDPPGLYGELAGETDSEQALWSILILVYLSPLEDAGDPFEAIRGALTPWAGGELPDPDRLARGPRSPHEPGAGTRALAAYRGWASRAGSQQRAFAGDHSWTASRRFGRLHERLALPGFGRAGRFELLTVLGRLGLFELEADGLHFRDGDPSTLAAKRVFGIADPLLLERRASELASAVALPLDALDLALYNWQADRRATLGARVTTGGEPALSTVRAALGL